MSAAFQARLEAYHRHRSNLRMNCVILDGPYEIRTELREVPTLDQDQEGHSALVQVIFAGLCGSDIWNYKGLEECPAGTIQGHEFLGRIIEMGKAVKGFEVGDMVVSPFTISCGQCWYCLNDLTSRCIHSQLYGSANLPGAQAEYVRVPFAQGTLFKLEEHDVKDMKLEVLILLADVAPTGLFGVLQALEHNALAGIKGRKTVVVVGCGPVGLCAVAAAVWRGAKVIAIDGVAERRGWAEKLGAIALDKSDSAAREVKAQSNERGADAVIDAVGLPEALTLGIECVRPHGVVSSVGVHQTMLPLHGQQVFNKNLHFSFGRCPARALMPMALQMLKAKDMSFLITHTPKLDGASHWYKEFAAHRTGKVVFDTLLEKD